MTHWIQEKAKCIEIRFTVGMSEKIIKETEKTWKDGYWTHLYQDRITGEWILKIIEMYHPEYETAEEKAENKRIFEEIRNCGLDEYLTRFKNTEACRNDN